MWKNQAFSVHMLSEIVLLNELYNFSENSFPKFRTVPN